MSRLIRLLALVAASVALAAGAASSAAAAPGMTTGFFDDAQTVYGNPAVTYPLLKDLKAQVVRIALYWGFGTVAVAKSRPADPTNPADPAYNWAAYDRAVQFANEYGLNVLFSIWGTPDWANRTRGPRVAPSNPIDLQNFAYAAARRYSGTYLGSDRRLIPPVRLWLAWNEPNNPAFLLPQFTKQSGKWVVQSAIAYAKICNAVYTGVHLSAYAGEKVACGGTSPRGNNGPSSSRPSVSPIAFLRAVAKTGKVSSDAWAHHPYYGKSSEEPDREPPRPSNGAPTTAITLGNLNSLVSEVTRLFGKKRIWITEYGYQTNPPDSQFGVSWATQAKYMKMSYTIARANPHVDMFIWFLLRDEPNLGGWQSGVMDVAGKKKPSYATFRSLPR